MYFKSIEDILNSGILSERISEGFSDNVLKSTRLEREIFRDIFRHFIRLRLKCLMMRI